METLAEVAVADADAATRAIYESIMKHSGTGTPALIFRHFAVFPGFLEWTWQAVGDELKSGRVISHSLDAVARTPRLALPPISTEKLVAAGVNAAGQTKLGTILTSYNRMNPMNYTLIAAIRDLLAKPDAPSEDAAALPPVTAKTLSPCLPLPPPVKLQDMPADLQQAMLALSAAIPGSDGKLIPTLYRHLAIWPDLMRLLAPAILAAINSGEVSARINDLKNEMKPLFAFVAASARKKGLPPPTLENPETMLRTLDSFLFAIPKMIVVGAAIEASMPHGTLTD